MKAFLLSVLAMVVAGVLLWYLEFLRPNHTVIVANEQQSSNAKANDNTQSPQRIGVREYTSVQKSVKKSPEPPKDTNRAAQVEVWAASFTTKSITPETPIIGKGIDASTDNGLGRKNLRMESLPNYLVIAWSGYLKIEHAGKHVFSFKAVPHNRAALDVGDNKQVINMKWEQRSASYECDLQPGYVFVKVYFYNVIENSNLIFSLSSPNERRSRQITPADFYLEKPSE